MPLVHINPFHLEHLPLDAYPQVIDQAASTFIDGYRQALLTSHIVIGVNINDTEGFSHAIQTAARQFVEEHYSRSGNGENKEEMIATLIEKNENNINLRYSRQCNICLTPSPDTRVTLTACGHLLCMACVLQIEVHGRLDCPFCKKSTGFVKMYEDREEEDQALDKVRDKLADLSFDSLSSASSVGSVRLRPRFTRRSNRSISPTVTRPTVSHRYRSPSTPTVTRRIFDPIPISSDRYRNVSPPRYRSPPPPTVLSPAYQRHRGPSPPIRNRNPSARLPVHYHSSIDLSSSRRERSVSSHSTVSHRYRSPPPPTVPASTESHSRPGPSNRRGYIGNLISRAVGRNRPM